MKKQNKGITLVALVITIIVLIILAGVSINAVMNGGVIENAKDAKNEYQEAKIEEQDELARLEQTIIDSEVEKDFANNTTYKFKNGYLTGVELATRSAEVDSQCAETVASFRSKLPTAYEVYNVDGTAIDNTTAETMRISTGMLIKKITETEEKIVGRVVIYGDIVWESNLEEEANINGDDLQFISRWVAENFEEEINSYGMLDIRKVAADMTHDGEVDYKDVAVIARYLANWGGEYDVIVQDDEAMAATEIRIKDYAVERAEYIAKLPEDVQKMFVFNEEKKKYVFTGVEEGDTPAKWIYPDGVFPEEVIIYRPNAATIIEKIVGNDQLIQSTGDWIYITNFGIDGDNLFAIAEIIIE